MRLDRAVLREPHQSQGYQLAGDGFGGSIRGEVVLFHYDFCGNSQQDVNFAFAE